MSCGASSLCPICSAKCSEFRPSNGGNEAGKANPAQVVDEQAEALKQGSAAQRRWMHTQVDNGMEMAVPIERYRYYDGVSSMFNRFEGDYSSLDWTDYPFVPPVVPVVSSSVVPPTEYSGGSADGPRIVKEEEPAGNVISNFDSRLLVVPMANFFVPFLGFFGIWNNSMFSSGLNAFAKHWGLHYHREDVAVSLPEPLVEDLASFWSHRVRDPEGKEFAVSVAKTRQLCNQTALTGKQQLDAVTYAPVLAYTKYWDVQQNAARVWSGAYARSGFGESIRKSCATLMQFQRWLVILAVILCLVFTVCHVSVIEPEYSDWCFISSHFPTISLAHPVSTYYRSCIERHHTQWWLIDRITWLQWELDFGCVWYELDYSWYYLSTENPTCTGYYLDYFWYSLRPFLAKW